MAAERTPQLLESLLADPAFRAAFRADPEAALRAAGLRDLAERAAAAPARKAFETLEVRESRSSLAGAMMAVVAEGLAIAGPASASAAPPAAHPPAPLPPVQPHAVGSPAGSVGPDDVVEVVERRNVAAQEHAASQQSLESDGSGGDEPDENEPDENEPSSGGDGGSDGDQDAPGEGSNGEDAHDNSSDGSSSDSSSSSDGGDSSDGSSDGGDSSDGSSDGGDSSDGSSDGGGNSDGSDAPAIPDPGSYPGDSAAPADLARWMGAAAQKRGLPAELPVMAALTESGMRNLNYGDADSVGFFQMRVGVWNNGAYAGYPQNPQKQLDWFLDHAQAVGAQRRARGLPVNDPKQYGDWIADVERPAAQYRGRYQLNYDRAHHLLDTPAPARHRGADGVDVAAVGELLPGPRAVAALAEARRYIGTPYHWGGASPSTGFDCSGLVQWAYAKVGIHIPRVTDQQILAGTPVDRKSLMPGDLVFFRDSTGYVHHVGMSLGGDKFVNAPHTGADVRINSLKEPYFAQQFTGGRRFDRAVAAAHRVSADARFLPAVKRSQLPER